MSRFAAGSQANTMLVTKALSQDVMVLAFVPLSLIPKEFSSLHFNQPFAKYGSSGMVTFNDIAER
ncbi:hypothetical protein LSPCS325_28210 [Lysinibacillus sp. CTST325]